MTSRTVIRMGHPTLKQVAELVKPSDFNESWFKELIIDLYDTMKTEGGIGIAAPQINVSKQIAIIELPEDSDRYEKLTASPLFIIINPKITYLTDELQEFYEGCLSVPGLRGMVPRPKKVKIDYLDQYKTEQSITVENFLATVFQHELDHLFGKLFVERITDPSSLTFNEEFELYHKKAKTID